MDGLERLLAIEDIKTLEARRNRLLDTKDWEAYAALHLPEAVADTGPEPLKGVAAIVESLRKQTQDAVTVHHIHSPEIEFVSPDRAHAVWAVEAMTLFRRPGGTTSKHTYGFNHVDYERRDGVWKIGDRRHQRLRADTVEHSSPL